MSRGEALLPTLQPALLNEQLVWIISQRVDGPPLGFGATKEYLTIFAGEAAEERARESFDILMKEFQEDNS